MNAYAVYSMLYTLYFAFAHMKRRRKGEVNAGYEAGEQTICAPSFSLSDAH